MCLPSNTLIASASSIALVHLPGDALSDMAAAFLARCKFSEGSELFRSIKIGDLANFPGRRHTLHSGSRYWSEVSRLTRNLAHGNISNVECSEDLVSK